MQALGDTTSPRYRGCCHLTPSCCRLSPPALPACLHLGSLPQPSQPASPIQTFSSPSLVTSPSISLTQPNQSTLQAAPSCHCCPVPPFWRADTWQINFPFQIPAGCLTLIFLLGFSVPHFSILPQSFAWSLPPRPQIKGFFKG